MHDVHGKRQVFAKHTEKLDLIKLLSCLLTRCQGWAEGAAVPLLLNNFFFLIFKISAECILSIPWMIEIVDFIQTSYSKNIIFV